jgi:hypothetical protein
MTRCALTLAMIFAIFGGVTPARAQTRPGQPDQASIQTGDTELRFWAEGGHALNGRTANDGVWSAGVRYGWVLTQPFLPRPLRGRFEYAIDAVPVFMVYQPGGAVYGASFQPISLIWDFDVRSRIVPYTELSGGVLWSQHGVPLGSSPINFTTQNGFGLHFMRDKWDVNAEILYMHISSAGLKEPNSGINTLQARIGIGRFFHHPKPPR